MSIEYLDKPKTYSLAAGLTMEVIGIEYGIDDHIIWKWAHEKKEHRAKLSPSRMGARFRTPAGTMWLTWFC